MRYTLLPLMLAALLAIAGCEQSTTTPNPAAPGTQTPAKPQDTPANPATPKNGGYIELSIKNMMCTSCQATVKKILEEQPGVMAADVNWEAGNARVTLKAGSKFDETAARAALDKQNFELVKAGVPVVN